MTIKDWVKKCDFWSLVKGLTSEKMSADDAEDFLLDLLTDKSKGDGCGTIQSLIMTDDGGAHIFVNIFVGGIPIKNVSLVFAFRGDVLNATLKVYENAESGKPPVLDPDGIEGGLREKVVLNILKDLTEEVEVEIAQPE